MVGSGRQVIRFDHRATGRLRIGSQDIRLAEVMHPGRPLLVHLTGSGHLADLTGAWRDRVDLVTAQTSAPPADALLIRPDGYVAWALGPDSEDHLEALETWFGGPMTQPGTS
jgi:hypothetical protein